MQAAAGFVKGWLEARDVEVTGTQHNGRPLLTATVGHEGGPTIVLHGHLDVVPGRPEQFEPRIDGDRLYGRGAYDMKGGLAAMIRALRDMAAQERWSGAFRVRLDEERNSTTARTTREGGLPRRLRNHRRAHRLHIGIQAKACSP